MTYGPDKILCLPRSGTLTRISTLASGNTFGATQWTDGRQVIPMLPDDPWLRLHRPTGEFFWTDECEEAGEDLSEEDHERWEGVAYADDPTPEDLWHALEQCVTHSEEKLRYLRVWLWWKQNDTVRETGRLQADADQFRVNALEIIRTSDLDNPNQRLMAAEAARNIGEFGQALSLLGAEFPAAYEHAVEKIRTLALQQDRLVRQL